MHVCYRGCALFKNGLRVTGAQTTQRESLPHRTTYVENNRASVKLASIMAFCTWHYLSILTTLSWYFVFLCILNQPNGVRAQNAQPQQQQQHPQPHAPGVPPVQAVPTPAVVQHVPETQTQSWYESLPAVAMDYKVHIDAGKEDCYWQYVQPGATFYVSFQVMWVTYPMCSRYGFWM